MLVRIIDFETTGIPPDACIVEIGVCDLWITDEETTIDPPRSILVDPGRSIPVEARAIHHISDEDVLGAPKAHEILADLLANVHVFAAHHSKFEKALFDGGDLPWVCSLKVARRLWPDCPSHSNQCLRYWLNLDLDPALAMPPHRAGPDAFVTANILRRALDEATVDQMIEWTKQPSLLPRVTFGKHRGKGWHEVDDGYLEWILRQTDMDADVVFTARHHLKARAF